MLDGVLMSVSEEPAFACRNPERFGDGTRVFIIEERRPTYWVEGSLRGFSTADLMDVVGVALNTAWGSRLDVAGRPASNAASANLLVVCTNIDGPQGALGDCEMPRRGVRQQRLRLDVAENVVLAVNPSPGKLDLQAIVNHEVGHFLGYPHWPTGEPRELMEPAIIWGLRDPQPTEVAWGVKLFGPAKTPSPPAGEAPGVDLTITVGYVKYRAIGNAKRIA